MFAEYTTSKSSNISTHLLKKKIIFDHILQNKNEFIEFFENVFPSFKDIKGNYFSTTQCKIIIVYCSKNSISRTHKEQVPDIIYFDYSILKYFHSLTNSIKRSAKFELFDFFRLKYNEIGRESVKTSESPSKYEGTILPEDFSNFSQGYKIVSFYIDPASLLKKSYVLRKDGWKEETGLYQRMISNKKIGAIRRYLNTKERVFVNNIIVTLPSKTKLLDSDGNTINPATLEKTSPVIIQIPDGFNSIGLIDGQHRIFAYHEGGEFEEKISGLREKQNLLATGIIYPNHLNDFEKIKFESELFLEINSNQTGAVSELKQAIGLMLKPFSSESIAKAVLNKLNLTSPLENQFETHFYEKDKVKTASIVSFGLRPIVKLSGLDSFYELWGDSSKIKLKEEKNRELLSDYINFCVTEINMFLSAVKSQIDNSKWTSDKDIKNKVLSTTAINGLIICLRKLIEDKKTGDFEYYRKKFDGLNDFDFSSYKSSQYGAMSSNLYNKFFK